MEGEKSPGLNVVQFPIDTGIPEINLRFGFDQIGDGFYSPRHRHNFDQFRYVVYGETNIAKGRDLHQGEIGYFPEGTYYGPLTQRGDVGLLVMQFPGPQGEYRIADDEKQAAMDRLRAKGGTFEDGIYKYTKADGTKVNQDSYEAVWQETTGRPVEYAKPRYAAPIMVRPQGFQWRKHPKHPGVEVKNLGSFHEYGTAISIWRLAPGNGDRSRSDRCAGSALRDRRRDPLRRPAPGRQEHLLHPRGRAHFADREPQGRRAAGVLLADVCKGDLGKGARPGSGRRLIDDVGKGLYATQQGGGPAGSSPCSH